MVKKKVEGKETGGRERRAGRGGRIGGGGGERNGGRGRLRVRGEQNINDRGQGKVEGQYESYSPYHNIFQHMSGIIVFS